MFLFVKNDITYNFSHVSNQEVINKLLPHFSNEPFKTLFKTGMCAVLELDKKTKKTEYYKFLNRLTLGFSSKLKFKYQFYSNILQNIEFLKIADKKAQPPYFYPIALSDREQEFFIKQIKLSKQYLEFGSGGSTFLTLANTEAKIFSVESDNGWLDFLKEWDFINAGILENRLNFINIDIGKTGAWGKLVDDSGRNQYPQYSLKVFDLYADQEFDTVFIDGRFRVACALAVILNCQKSVKIIMHDYTNRSEYFVVERFLEKIDSVEATAIFKIKEDISLDDVRALFEEYKYNFT